jgi:DNA-binding XRE family transcriptional regulator
MTVSLTHLAEEELGDIWRIPSSDSCLLCNLGDFLLSERAQKTDDLLFFGRAIRELRERRPLSTNQLAAAVGIDERRIQALEAGQLDPDYELLIALAEGLGVSPAELVIRAERLAAGHQLP